jgi:predicted nucleic acid-binding protein
MQQGVFDTNILIDFLRGDIRAKAEIARYATPIISRITWIEVCIGIEAGNQKELAVHSFLNRFQVIDTNFAISNVAITLRRKHRLRLPNALIWATAEHHQALLITRNTKDFPPTEPDIRVPYTI